MKTHPVYLNKAARKNNAPIRLHRLSTRRRKVFMTPAMQDLATLTLGVAAILFILFISIGR